jgi:hypothetical protein
MEEIKSPEFGCVTRAICGLVSADRQLWHDRKCKIIPITAALARLEIVAPDSDGGTIR